MGAFILVGLVLLAAGAAFVDVSKAMPNPGESQADAIARANYGRVTGPLLAHVGMFFFVVGLLAAAMFFTELDVFARLFLMILAFVSVLLVLAGSTSIFGVP